MPSSCSAGQQWRLVWQGVMLYTDCGRTVPVTRLAAPQKGVCSAYAGSRQTHHSKIKLAYTPQSSACLRVQAGGQGCYRDSPPQHCAAEHVLPPPATSTVHAEASSLLPPNAHVVSHLHRHRLPCRQLRKAASHDTMVQAVVPMSRLLGHYHSSGLSTFTTSAGQAKTLTTRLIHCARRKAIKLPLRNAHHHPHPQGPLLGAESGESPIGWQPRPGAPAMALPVRTC